jgi:uncharacterized protein YbcV (DUF1398 family)
MFTVAQIKLALANVKTGADFPKYIQEIKQLGVVSFETWVSDSHTQYFSENGFQTCSEPKYDPLAIAEACQKDQFVQYLLSHQKGETDYVTFYNHCAETDIEKWIVDLLKFTCTYYDKAGNAVLMEAIPIAQ